MIKHGEASSQQSIHLQSAVLKNTSVSEPTPKCGIKKQKNLLSYLISLRTKVQKLQHFCNRAAIFIEGLSSHCDYHCKLGNLQYTTKKYIVLQDCPGSHIDILLNAIWLVLLHSCCAAQYQKIQASFSTKFDDDVKKVLSKLCNHSVNNFFKKSALNIA